MNILSAIKPSVARRLEAAALTHNERPGNSTTEATLTTPTKCTTMSYCYLLNALCYRFVDSKLAPVWRSSSTPLRGQRFTQHQDGEPKTASNLVKNYLTAEQSHIVPTQSPDLNPAGCLWGQSKMETPLEHCQIMQGNMAYIQTLRSCSAQLNLSAVQKWSN